MPVGRRLVTLGALAVVSVAPVAAQERPCMDVTQATVSFTGVLTHKVFPGSPNFESVRKGDKPEPTYILQLRKRICVSGDKFIDKDREIDRIQVFPAEPEDKAIWSELKKAIGRTVTVEGSGAFGEFNGHHHAPLLLPLTKITPAVKG